MSDAEIHNYGYNIYRHDRVALLLAIDTAERLYTPGSVWRSPTFNSMSVTLESQEGAILIATTYLPSGVDYMSKENLTKVRDQHHELHSRANSHEMSILTMDANETTHATTSVAYTHLNRTHPSATPPTSLWVHHTPPLASAEVTQSSLRQWHATRKR